MVHHALSESGAVMPPAYTGKGRCSMQNDKEVLDNAHANLMITICQVIHEKHPSQGQSDIY
jgi:hypothetical protein